MLSENTDGAQRRLERRNSAHSSLTSEDLDDYDPADPAADGSKVCALPSLAWPPLNAPVPPTVPLCELVHNRRVNGSMHSAEYDCAEYLTTLIFWCSGRIAQLWRDSDDNVFNSAWVAKTGRVGIPGPTCGGVDVRDALQCERGACTGCGGPHGHCRGCVGGGCARRLGWRGSAAGIT